MNRLFFLLALITMGSMVLGAGCAPKPVSSQNSDDPGMARDSVMMPEPAPMPIDLIQTGEITVDGAATFAQMTVAELTPLRAQTQAQRDVGQQAVSSGAYLGDSVRVVRMVADDSQGVIGYDVGADFGTSFETEFLVRFQEGGGDIAFEIVGEPTQSGRRMPSMFSVEVSLEGIDAENSVVLNLGHGGGAPSELGRVALPSFAPEDYAHRVGVRYEPGSIIVRFDGEVILEKTARLGGGNATAAILARPAETAYVLSWTFETQP